MEHVQRIVEILRPSFDHVVVDLGSRLDPRALWVLEQSDAHVFVLFPEIAALRGTQQDPEWHPEGDVFTHTAHCCDALVQLDAWQNASAERRRQLLFAVLAHGAEFLEHVDKLAEGPWAALGAPDRMLGCCVAGDAVKIDYRPVHNYTMSKDIDYIEPKARVY